MIFDICKDDFVDPHGEASMSGVDGANAGTNVLEELRSALEKYCEVEKPEEVDESTSVSSLDLDSISLAYVFAHIERSYGIAFENEKVDPGAYGTVADLVTTIEAQVRRAAA